ncbi:hypothetical protein AMECASPLE_000588 [Ameca splendens]|uniref:Uncharacterized protein n=1 Tax=Ameca splendens TaxID=208324 RepID=A0ABV0ZI86_9TELE
MFCLLHAFASLLQLPGTCEPKEGTNLSSGSPACKTPACPPSNFTYTTCKETQRNNHHLNTTSPVKLSLCGVTHLSLETPILRNISLHGACLYSSACMTLS